MNLNNRVINLKPFIVIIVLFISFFFMQPQTVLAVKTTLQFSPSNGSFDKLFTTELIIDGNGEAFNAAQAKINLSKNLVVEDLVLGNCNFSFLTTPNKINPSFEGVILGNLSKKCTVYTLTISANKKGEATINLLNAKVLSYKQATNILTKTQNGKYTITAISSKEVLGEQIKGLRDGLYSIKLTILSEKNEPVKDTPVVLNTAQGKLPIEKQTDQKGFVTFSNLQPGIYTATVQDQKIILNLRGEEHVMELSIKLKPKDFLSQIFVLWQFIVIGIIIVSLIIIALFIFKKRKK
jgi:hypothetical protein